MQKNGQKNLSLSNNTKFSKSKSKTNSREIFHQIIVSLLPMKMNFLGQVQVFNVGFCFKGLSNGFEYYEVLITANEFKL